MDKEIFNKLFNNYLLRKKIFEDVCSFSGDRTTVRWHELIERPDILVLYNYISLLKQYYTRYPFSTNEKQPNDLFRISAVNAINSGNLELLRYLITDVAHESKIIYNNNKENDLMWYAARKGSMEIIDYLESILGKRKWFYSLAFSASPLSGDIEICKYFILKSAKSTSGICGKQAFINAAEAENLEILTWICGNLSLGSKDIATWRAAFINVLKKKNYTLMSWLLGKGEEFEFSSFSYQEWEVAISKRDVELLDWLWQNKGNDPIPYNLYSFAARDFDRSIIEWIISKGGLHDPTSLGLVANLIKHNVSIKDIKWLHQRLSENNENGIMNDHPEKNLFILETFYRHNVDTIDLAVKYNNMQIIEWVHQTNGAKHGFPYALDAAVDNNNMTMIKWFLDNNRPESISWHKFKSIIDSNNLELAKCFLKSPNLMFIENIVAFDTSYRDALDYIIMKDKMELANWFVENRTERWSSKVMDFADKIQNKALIGWLNANK